MVWLADMQSIAEDMSDIENEKYLEERELAKAEAGEEEELRAEHALHFSGRV